ncbi:VOC family protein [Sphingopyxis flava]|uniref:Glyoxalase/Bleomycin resistance protein/Dioxygenase superfamily protein n=1 Tax=Sphingopyxis flava TaxID=1507287 RepID=A0A1T5G5T5_9SPHN|nr:VOC family protein [Sphingopyxis flava]SKC03815.1 Glyoxalase/Bleomycin resistance protein/Dioxygenase superfamily protein [Sphingopyxis flava]
MTTAPPNAQFKHVGIYVRNLEAMAAFYKRVLGLVVTDSGVTDRGGKIVFLSRSPTEHHQIVLVEGRSDGMGEGLINQLSFRLDSLGDLKTFNEIIKAEGVRVDRTMNHGNAWSIYCFDPEGNRLELYAGSPWYIAQPCAEPLDLDEPEDVIVAKTHEMVLADPTYASKEEWDRKQAAAVGAASPAGS